MHAVTPENGLPSFKPSRQSIATSSLVTWRKEERAPVIRNLLRAATPHPFLPAAGLTCSKGDERVAGTWFW